MEEHCIKAISVPINWHSGVSIFASEPFLKTLSGEYGWLGGVGKDGVVRCVLPYSVIHRSVFRMVRFPVETIDVGGGLEIEEEKAFLTEAVEYLRLTGVDSIIPATFNTVFRTFPEGAIAAPFGSFVLDLRQSEDALWKNLHSKHRNVIRNAMNKGVTIRSGPQYLETAYRLVRDSFRRSAKGVIGRLRIGFRSDEHAFRRQILSLDENAIVLAAEYEGAIQGSVVIPFSDYRGYYMHGGSIANPLTGVMNLLQWEAIRILRQRGVHQYDFFGARIAPDKGSKIEGIMKFKERFGGELVRGYMWKFPFRSLKYRLYCLAAGLRSGGDVVDQEHHKLSRQ